MRRKRGGAGIAIIFILMLLGAAAYYWFVYRPKQEQGQADLAAQEQVEPADEQAAGPDDGEGQVKKAIEAKMKARYEQRMRNIPE